MNDPENLDAIGKRAVEDEIALETLYGPGAHRRKAGIPKISRAPQFRHLREGLNTDVAGGKEMARHIYAAVFSEKYEMIG